MSDGNFWITGAKGTALPNSDGDLYEFIQNQTAASSAGGPVDTSGGD